MELPKGAELLASAAQRLRADFDAIRGGIPHYGEQGRETQEALIRFLNNHVPKRFLATSGFIIDPTGTQSRHLDVILYDQVDAFAFSPADNTLIVPNDNVAAVIEVKSALDKAQLRSAADQIAHAKGLAKTPPLPTDYPTTNTHIQHTKTRGVVFAYSATTSLQTLWSNLREINATSDSALWVDELIVLDSGWISYDIQLPLSHLTAHYAGITGPRPIIFPSYVLPVLCEVPSTILSTFMFRLAAHLAHYRRRPAPVSTMLLPPDLPCTSMRPYWFDTAGKLHEVPESRLAPTQSEPFDRAQGILFSRADGQNIGQVEWHTWADGHFFVFRVSGLAAPDLVIRTCLEPYGKKIQSIEPTEGIHLTELLPGSQPPDFARVFALLSSEQMPWRAKLIDSTGDSSPPAIA